MKALLVVGLLISTISHASYLPMNTYECTSTAKFYNKNRMVEVDKKVVISGYQYGDIIGKVDFVHSYKNHKIRMWIQIFNGIFNGSNEIHSVVWYAHEHALSSFSAIEEELPSKFVLSLRRRVLVDDLWASLRVVCFRK